jgi:predicted ATPase
MVALAKQQSQKFLIETHSDYLVDRIRIDIMEKKHDLRPEDVAFLYFERQGGGVQIHRLLLNEQGDIVNAPPGYRKFILQEERRFLGI